MPLRVRVASIAGLTVGLAGLLSAGPASGQNPAPDAQKAKAAAIENMKKLKIDKPTLVETDNFLVVGTIPEAKAKSLAETLEKTLKVARAAAKFEATETAWKGKLTVYYLPEADDYKTFMRRVLQLQPDTIYTDFRAEPPLVVEPADVPGKATEADVYARLAGRIAGELLRAKGTGTQVIPEWLRDGFGRAAALRADGTTSNRYKTYRTQARAAVLNPKIGRSSTLADVMSGEKGTEILATSFAEFLAFGPKAAEFAKFLDALRPSEENPNPTPQIGFTALGWKDEMAVELAWKRWVQTGK